MPPPAFSPRLRAPTRTDLLTGLAAALLLGALLPIGCVRPTAAATFALFAGIAGVVAAQATGLGREPVPPIVLPFAFFAAWSAFQGVRLPMKVLAFVAPHSADEWSRALRPLALPAPATATISLAPELTWEQAAKWAAYAIVAWLGHEVGRRRGINVVAWITVALAILAGVITVVHGFLGLEKVYGVYTPVVTYPKWRLGPLLNANHLSAYLNLGIGSCLVLLLGDRKPIGARTAVVLGTCGSLVAGVLVLASRAAVAVLLLTSAALLVAHQLKSLRRRDYDFVVAQRAVAAGAILVLGAGLAFLGYEGEIEKGLGEKNIEKLLVARDAIPMIKDFWATGAGRGAFATVFPEYIHISQDAFWTHPENIVVQWTSEWGVPASIVGAFLVGRALFRAHVAKTSSRALLVALGLGGLVVHNLVDFSLEIPAVAALAAFQIGAVCGAPPERRHRSRERAADRPTFDGRGRAAILLGAATIAIATAAIVRRPLLPEDVRREAYVLSQSARKSPETDAELERLIRRFPADPYLPLYGGAIAYRVRPLSAIPWYGRALERAPRLAPIHFALAHALGAAGFRSQALLHVRAALGSGSTLAEALAIESARFAVSLARNEDDLFSVIPEDGTNEIEYLRALLQTLPPGSPSVAAVRARLLNAAPCDLETRGSAARDLLGAIEGSRPPCDGTERRARCSRDVDAHVAALRKCPGGEPLATEIDARRAWNAGRRADALDALERSCAGLTDSGPCLEKVAQQAADARDQPRLKRLVRQLTMRQCGDVAACSRAWRTASMLQAAADDDVGSLASALHAVDVDPTDPQNHQAAAEAALRAGAYDRAAVEARRVLARRPGDGPATAVLERATERASAIQQRRAAEAPETADSAKHDDDGLPTP